MDTLVPYPKIRGSKNPLKLKLQLPQSPFDIIVAQQSLPPSNHQYYFPIFDVTKKFEESLQTCRKKRKQKKIIKAIEKVTISKQMSQNIIESYRKSQTNDSRNRGRCTSESVETKECNSLRTRRASELVDQLLLDIYGRTNFCPDKIFETEYGSSTSFKSIQDKFDEKMQFSRLVLKDVTELRILIGALKDRVTYAGNLLVKQLKKRDALKSKQEKICNVITAHLHAYSDKRSEDTSMRFSPSPIPGDSGFNQWRDAMKMVAKLPGGIPPEFRKKLWIALAEKHLQSKGVNWTQTEKLCFNEWSNPDDSELGIQIVKDLHRTGCSLFCGAAGQENQALLKRVLLAYARWNKNVGYCQGFNMLAALILQVMDKNETDSVKVMIYLIEGVLPESYFANNLRGLSVDMIVFRDLLKMRLPLLSKHLEALQNDGRDGNSYEPPLTNVFTMQWFLTLFCNCLPQATVLRVWDLIFLEGNEILLRTAIAIWDKLSDRILAVNSADEFYSIMGVLTREMLEFGLVDSNTLIKSIVAIGTCSELNEMRDKYLYNITPWTQSVQTAARKGFKLFYSDDDEVESDYDEKAAVTAAYGISIGRKREKQPNTKEGNVIQPYAYGHPDRERLALDISALKKQYAKLRERQRQAHIILQAACARQPMGQNSNTPPIAMNHLLLGKSAIVNSRGRRLGPPKGSIPPARTKKQEPAKKKDTVITGETIHWKDTAKFRRRQSTAEDTDTSQETFIPESDSSSYSEDDASSTSTELCDEPNRMSDFDSDEKITERKTDKNLQNNLNVDRSADNSALPTETMDSGKNLGKFSCSGVTEIQNEVGALITNICELKFDDKTEQSLNDSGLPIETINRGKNLGDFMCSEVIDIQNEVGALLPTKTKDKGKNLNEFNCSEVTDRQNEVETLMTDICELKFDDKTEQSPDNSRLPTETKDRGKNLGEFICSQLTDIQNEVGAMKSNIYKLKFDDKIEPDNSRLPTATMNRGKNLEEFSSSKVTDIHNEVGELISDICEFKFDDKTEQSPDNSRLPTETINSGKNLREFSCSEVTNIQSTVEELKSDICELKFDDKTEQSPDKSGLPTETMVRGKNLGEFNCSEVTDIQNEVGTLISNTEQYDKIEQSSDKSVLPTKTMDHGKNLGEFSCSEVTDIHNEVGALKSDNSGLPTATMDRGKNLGEFSCSEVSDINNEVGTLTSDICELKFDDKIEQLHNSDSSEFGDFKSSEFLLPNTTTVSDKNSLFNNTKDSGNNTSLISEMIDYNNTTQTDICSNTLPIKIDSNNKTFDTNMKQQHNTLSTDPLTLKPIKNEQNTNEIIEESKREDNFDTFLEERIKILKQNNQESIAPSKDETTFRHFDDKLRRHKSYDETSKNQIEKSVICKQNSFDISSLPIIETSLWKPYQIDEESPRDETPDESPKEIHPKLKKQTSIDLLQVEDKRLETGRRNSERALKIIQENSLILHRILQQQKSSEKEESEDELSRSPISRTFLRSESLLSKDEKTDEERSSKDGDDELNESGVESFSVSPALLDEDETLIISKTDTEYSYKQHNTNTFEDNSTKYDIASNIMDYSKDNLQQNSEENTSYRFSYKYHEDSHDKLELQTNKNEDIILEKENTTDFKSKEIDASYDSKHEALLTFLSTSTNVSPVQKTNENLMTEMYPDEKQVFKYSDELVSSSNFADKLDQNKLELDILDQDKLELDKLKLDKLELDKLERDKLELKKLERDKFSPNVSAIQKTNEDPIIEACHKERPVYKYSDDLSSSSNLNNKLELNKLELDKFSPNNSAMQKTNESLMTEVSLYEKPVYKYSDDFSSSSNLKDKLDLDKLELSKLRKEKLDPNNLEQDKLEPNKLELYKLELGELEQNKLEGRNTDVIFKETPKENPVSNYSVDLSSTLSLKSDDKYKNPIFEQSPEEISKFSASLSSPTKLKSNNKLDQRNIDLIFEERPQDKTTVQYSADYLPLNLKSDTNLDQARNTSLTFEESQEEKTTFKYSTDVCSSDLTNETELGRNNVIKFEETPTENPISQYSKDLFPSSKLQSNNVTDPIFEEMSKEKSTTKYSDYLSDYLKSEENSAENASKAEMKSYLRDSVEDIFKTSVVQEDNYKYNTASKSFDTENISYSPNDSYSKESSSSYKYHFREDSDDNISRYHQNVSKVDEFTCKSTFEDAKKSDFSYKYTLESPEYTQNTSLANTSSYSETQFETLPISTVKSNINDTNNDNDNKLIHSNTTKTEYNKSNLSINLKPSNIDDYSPEISPPKNLSCLQFTSFQTDIPCTSKSIQFSPICTKTNNITSPAKSTPKFFNFPTLSPPRRTVKSPLSPNKTFSPFPVQPTTRQPKELGVKLGMYKDLSPLKSPNK